MDVDLPQPESQLLSGSTGSCSSGSPNSFIRAKFDKFLENWRNVDFSTNKVRCFEETIPLFD